MDEHYSYWFAALAGETPNVTNEPQPGFYRMKNGNPVAIWHNEDPEDPHVEMLINGAGVIPRDFEDVWLRCCTRPVTQEAYEHVIDGGLWPDMDEGVAETIGHNIADANDIGTLQGLLGRLEQAAQAYDRIDSDEQASKAQSLRARALELKKKADDLRSEEKKPHLMAGQAIDKRWQPLVKQGQGIADGIRAAIGLWETLKLKAARKAQEEQEARKALDMPPAPESTPVNLPDGVRGGYGRAASTRLRKVVKDYDVEVLFQVYRHRGEIVTLLLSMAQKDLDAGLIVAGITVDEVVDVR